MLPIKSYIQLNKTAVNPLYQQIANAIITAIQQGFLKPSMKLPGTRQLSEELAIHRKTVVAAMEELQLQGWIETIPSKGTFVSSKLPILNYKQAKKAVTPNKMPYQPGFPLVENKMLDKPLVMNHKVLTINDGFPDHRLAPANEIGKHYRNVMSRSVSKSILSYTTVEGNNMLRKELADYLNETRGLSVTEENILITRGSQMGIYLIAKTLLTAGDKVIVGAPNYFVANITFKNLGAQLVTVPVDNNGIDMDSVEKLCKKHKIRAIFITPHHHYPTTVTLSVERRVRLLQLAKTYRFAIIEDDYDYDFHYSGNPLLPLTSADKEGLCVYVGSLSKTIAPAIRTGYIVAPEKLIAELAKVRRIIDRQGDPILEQVLAELLKSGEIRRILNKANKIYLKRRDAFCDLLNEKLNKHVQFQVPNGGMAVWATFHPRISFDLLVPALYKEGVAINHPAMYNPSGTYHNAIRMGFASLQEAEAQEGIEKLAFYITHKIKYK